MLQDKEQEDCHVRAAKNLAEEQWKEGWALHGEDLESNRFFKEDILKTFYNCNLISFHLMLLHKPKFSKRTKLKLYQHLPFARVFSVR